MDHNDTYIKKFVAIRRVGTYLNHVSTVYSFGEIAQKHFRNCGGSLRQKKDASFLRRTIVPARSHYHMHLFFAEVTRHIFEIVFVQFLRIESS